MNLRILTDLDDTILQFSDAMQDFLASKGRVITERMRDHYNIPKLFDIDVPTTIEYVCEFHRSPLMRDIRPEPCAEIVLPELHRRGFKFVAITACLNEPKVASMRRENLESAFGFEWEQIHCCGLTHDKRPVLETYPPSIWVEDVWHHAVTGAELGHRTFIIDRPHNAGKDHPGVTRVQDWHEIARQIL